MIVSAGFTRSAGAEKASVNDIEVIDVVGFAVGVQRAGPRIIAEANRAHLMRHAGERNPLSDGEVEKDARLQVMGGLRSAGTSV
jgi:hypothetical protein